MAPVSPQSPPQRYHGATPPVRRKAARSVTPARSSRPSCVAVPNTSEKTPAKGPAATYVRACARCQCAPLPGIVEDLSTRASLCIDLRVCKPEAFQAICVVLREAPCGIRQVVLQDGLAINGDDAAYRERAKAYRRRCRNDDVSPLELGPLRHLLSALVAFIAVRGAKLEVLDLSGLPLGRDIPKLLDPLAAALRRAKLQEMHWLGLAACRLGDRGLAVLMPWLTSGGALLRLEALSLASNGLADMRIVDDLLQARTRLCTMKRAAPLRLLELSTNPRLCDAGADAASQRALSERSGGGHRGLLMRSLAFALAQGLPLRVLWLRRMRLEQDDLEPLIEVLREESQRHEYIISAGYGRSSSFCLEELDLEGNCLDDSFLESTAESLRMLQMLREAPWPMGSGPPSQDVLGGAVPNPAPLPDMEAGSAAPGQVSPLEPTLPMYDIFRNMPRGTGGAGLPAWMAAGINQAPGPMQRIPPHIDAPPVAEHDAQQAGHRRRSNSEPARRRLDECQLLGPALAAAEAELQRDAGIGQVAGRPLPPVREEPLRNSAATDASEAEERRDERLATLRAEVAQMLGRVPSSDDFTLRPVNLYSRPGAPDAPANVIALDRVQAW
eukprot:TRINITY_DN80700_c0_g1_i1.p1 TRINITY_DN80700_c0_g1~~TRINITY_DN80700_c0_g1_i1.p1  ORF type:complete len:613 (-),score=126.09 TRINITY_DN80700_c0_g1_i1:177-2015(-)